MSEERWLPVEGYEGSYEVSSLGRIRALPRTSQTGMTLDAREVILSAHSAGYLKCGLRREGKTRTHFAHRIAARAFLGPAPEGREDVNHKDGNKRNNHISNLEWASRQENCAHAIETGLSPAQGGTHYLASMSNEVALEVRAWLNAGARICDIARFYEISRNPIRMMKYGRGWKSIAA
jgi:hypothetical protein